MDSQARASSATTRLARAIGRLDSQLAIETPLLAGLAVTPSALADTYAMLHPRSGTASLKRYRSDATSKPVPSPHD